MAVVRFLKTLRPEVRYTIQETKINGFAYLNDIVLYASTAKGMQRLLTLAEREVAKFELEFNPNKCVSMSILINGALKKYTITTEQLFTIASGAIKHLTVYLIVHFFLNYCKYTYEALLFADSYRHTLYVHLLFGRLVDQWHL